MLSTAQSEWPVYISEPQCQMNHMSIVRWGKGEWIARSKHYRTETEQRLRFINMQFPMLAFCCSALLLFLPQCWRYLHFYLSLPLIAFFGIWLLGVSGLGTLQRGTSKQLLFTCEHLCVCLCDLFGITSGDCGFHGAGRNCPIQLSYVLITEHLFIVLGLFNLWSAMLLSSAREAGKQRRDSWLHEHSSLSWSDKGVWRENEKKNG